MNTFLGKLNQQTPLFVLRSGADWGGGKLAIPRPFFFKFPFFFCFFGYFHVLITKNSQKIKFPFLSFFWPDPFFILNPRLVEVFHPDGIYFYNSNDFHLIRNYNHLNGRISQINSIFYEFNHQTLTVSCYDENANLKEQITLRGLDKFLVGVWDGAYMFHNRSLLIQSHTHKKIIKLFD